MSITFVQNNFIKNLFITKSNERKSETDSGHTSKPYNSSGKHLLLIIFKVTSSEAVILAWCKDGQKAGRIVARAMNATNVKIALKMLKHFFFKIKQNVCKR